MKPWKTLARETILDQGKYLVVENHTIELPDGRILPNWAWLITPAYINAMVLTDDDHFLCFRQTKYGIAGTSLAPLGGYLEPGEEPLACAQRELLEEMGCVADEWIKLGTYCVDGNRGAGTAHLFFARGARRVQAPDADDLEEQELVRLTRVQVSNALARGDFRVLAWAAVAALTLACVNP
ncbi:MAG: NUDIX hydrolase [Chloroflexi bacterium]|nr:NUDIX hydrolase [Chloroflexota bacterium]